MDKTWHFLLQLPVGLPNISLSITVKKIWYGPWNWYYPRSRLRQYHFHCHFYYFMCKVYWWLQIFFTVILRLMLGSPTGNCSKKCQVLSMSGFSYYTVTIVFIASKTRIWHNINAQKFFKESRNLQVAIHISNYYVYCIKKVFGPISDF
jgi:hypothetical protein